ncbi:MAG: Molybdopterin synthase catalytic subunit [Alphaproteobacteria bacterium MarineAlpha5_Bin11]|nr:MAG: Molybdopterin synthase catalytic subunit [Alphaproteobacteria bacterium MarineAlpha5_Bin11]PPR51961.1 MAG: Molybdopterin synthase catalytic subunit [Alphaproteobacteria bacterium MarineAlpha5_Bin10]|tara:strand:- start:207 stop:632 length:426 start_codon:yes stop_codon:yes gene_type:complete
MIKIQKKDFNIDYEINKIKSKHRDVGAASIFIGYVRDVNNKKNVKSIELEVYEDMAKKYLEELCLKTSKKWGITDILIIHRFGRLGINEKIVLIATFSKHRDKSFKACNFIMDFLKRDAPFWKKEYYKSNYKWLKNIKLKN